MQRLRSTKLRWATLGVVTMSAASQMRDDAVVADPKLSQLQWRPGAT